MQPIAVKCANCGSNLKISPNIESFACAYCGTHQVVRREGGAIFGEAIAGVKASTDRVAAELEIRRLRDEVARIDIEIPKLEKLVERRQELNAVSLSRRDSNWRVEWQKCVEEAQAEQNEEAQAVQKKRSERVAGAALLFGAIAAIIGRILFHYPWWVGIIVVLVSMAIPISLYESWNISNGLQTKIAEKIKERKTLDGKISNRIASLR